MKRISKALASLTFFFALCMTLGLCLLVGTLKPDWDLYHRPWFVALLGLLHLTPWLASSLDGSQCHGPAC
jgi:hypothetical protein